MVGSRTPRWVMRTRRCTLPRIVWVVLRALEFRPFLVKHIRIQAWVLVLHQSVCGLVGRQLHWVDHTCTGIRAAGCELSTVCHFGSTDWSGTFAILYAVVTFTCPAMCKANLVALCHFAVDLVHWEWIFYSCHSCSAIEHRVKFKTIDDNSKIIFCNKNT